MDLAWMAWTWQTGVFFATILALLLLMTIWEFCSPGGSPRRGVLRLHTTRGDRLFISLLSAAFIHLAWLLFAGTPLTGAMIASLILAVVIFKWV